LVAIASGNQIKVTQELRLKNGDQMMEVAWFKLRAVGDILWF
jgi:hypothetical protein